MKQHEVAEAVDNSITAEGSARLSTLLPEFDDVIKRKMGESPPAPAKLLKVSRKPNTQPVLAKQW